jgi:hypothetical protein
MVRFFVNCLPETLFLDKQLSEYCLYKNILLCFNSSIENPFDAMLNYCIERVFG